MSQARTTAQKKTRTTVRIAPAAPSSIVARDIMTEDPMTIDASVTIAEAIEVLAALEIRHLPVMRGKMLVGMLSDRDVKNLDGDVRSEKPVSSVMNTNIISVDPDATVVEIAEVLVENRIGAVPVVDPHDDDLIGIVSYVDVLRDLIRGAS